MALPRWLAKPEARVKARSGPGVFHGLYSSLALGWVFGSQTVLMNFQVSEVRLKYMYMHSMADHQPILDLD